MQILRSFLALLAGFASMAVVVGVFTAALVKLAPQWVGTPGHPRPAYVSVNLAYSFAAAALGGYVCAWIAPGNPLTHILALALIVLLLSGLSALQLRGKQPIWYQLTLIAISPLGILGGGLVRLRLL